MIDVRREDVEGYEEADAIMMDRIDAVSNVVGSFCVSNVWKRSGYFVSVEY